DSNCHTALHQIESCLKSAKDRHLVPDLLKALFPDKPAAREKILVLATTALTQSDDRPPDYSAFNTEELVYLSPPKIPRQTREQAATVAKQMRNPKTGK